MLKEQKLENDIFSLPEEELQKVQGHPQKVIDLIEKHFPAAMFLGKAKAFTIVDEIRALDSKFSLQSQSPLILAELGCYMGYSAILLTDLLLNQNENQPLVSKFYSFEIDPEYARIANRFVKLAGLEDRIEIIVGAASRSLVAFEERLKKSHNGIFTAVDFLLIDHNKSHYVNDLRIAESLNLIYPGTIIVADNIRLPGAPEYDHYIKSSPSAKRDHNYANANPVGAKFTGRWNIVYETKSIEVEMYTKKRGLDIIDITKCVDYLSG